MIGDQDSVLVLVFDSILHFHYFFSDRIKGILIKFGDYAKLTGATETWKAETRIQNHLNKLYKSHFKIQNKFKVVS